MTKEEIASYEERLKRYTDKRYGPDADMSHEEGFDWAESLAGMVARLLDEVKVPPKPGKGGG